MNGPSQAPDESSAVLGRHAAALETITVLQLDQDQRSRLGGIPAAESVVSAHMRETTLLSGKKDRKVILGLDAPSLMLE